jgi:acyl-CoA thioester hydrolase
MSETALLDVHVESVRPEWIDYNGHMNVAYYVLTFDHATDRFFDLIDLGIDYVRRENRSMFALECHVNFLREVKVGDPLRFSVQLVDHDRKRIHFLTRMEHRDEGYLAATCEWLSLHVDLSTRRSSDLPDHALIRLDEIRTSHARLPAPEHARRSIGIRRPA